MTHRIGPEAWWAEGVERYMRRRYLRDRATQAAIAGELGVSRRTVYNWMKEYGIASRGRADRGRRSLNTSYRGIP